MTQLHRERPVDEVSGATAGQTVPRLFARTVRVHPDEPAVRWRECGTSWSCWTWREYADSARRVAGVLDAGGIGRGDRVGIMLRNRPEFHAIDMGSHLAGATPFSIYNTASPEQVEYLLAHAEAATVFVEADLARTVVDVAGALSRPIQVVAVGGSAPAGGAQYADLMTTAAPVDLDVAARRCAPDDLATLIFTSGTTGPPKAVMLTHSNICWVLESFLDALGGLPSGCRMVSYLPMAHMLERLLTQYLPARTAAEVAPCPDPGALGEWLAVVRPELFVAPPRVWEKLRSAVSRKGLRGRDATAAIGLEQCRVALVGSAPSPRGLIDFFRDLGIPLSEGYGLSETSGVLTVETGRPVIGAVGRVTPGCEIRLAADGEICCRGGNVFAGYLNDDVSTAEAFTPDGWFRTGDIGTVDGNGFLTLVDRKKELIVTASGKNVSPANLEAALKGIPLVSQACVVGDGRPYLTALLVLDAAEGAGWAERNHVPVPVDPATLATHPAVLADVAAGVEKVNDTLSRAEQIKRFHLLGEEWAVDSDCLTPTMKLRRRGVHRRFAAEIDALYAQGAAAG